MRPVMSLLNNLHSLTQTHPTCIHTQQWDLSFTATYNSDFWVSTKNSCSSALAGSIRVGAYYHQQNRHKYIKISLKWLPTTKLIGLPGSAEGLFCNFSHCLFKTLTNTHYQSMVNVWNGHLSVVKSFHIVCVFYTTVRIKMGQQCILIIEPTQLTAYATVLIWSQAVPDSAQYWFKGVGGPV